MSAVSLPKLPKLPAGRSAGLLIAAVIAVVGITAAVAVFFWGQGQQRQAKQLGVELSMSQSELADLQAKHSALEGRLTDLRSEREGLDEILAVLRNQLAEASAGLVQSRLSQEEIEQEFEELVVERAELRLEVASLTDERDAQRVRADSFEKKASELGRSVSRFRERLALLNRDYERLSVEVAELRTKPHAGVNVVSSVGPTPGEVSAAGGESVGRSLAAGSVELPPIIVRKDSAGMSIPVRGRIVEVNQGHGFVVVDKGSLDGVRMGMGFDIVRGSSTVGRAKVIRVRPNLSACNIVRARTPGPVQSGDVAVQTGP